MINYPTKKLGEIILENKKSTLKSRGNSEGRYPFYVSGLKVKSINSYLVDGENIFLSTGGNFVVHFYNGKSAYSTDTFSIKSASGVDIKYLYYFLDLNQKEINNKMFKGATIRHLQKKELREMKIPLPPIGKQKKIVAKLEKLFEKIKEAERLRAEAEIAAKNLLSAELHKIFSEGKKKGWKIYGLSNICKAFTDGDWIESKDQSPNGVRLIQTGNIGNGEFLNKIGRSRFVSEMTFKRLTCTEIFSNDLLVSRLPDPVGRSCLVPKTGQRMITAVDCTIIRTDTKKAIRKYVMYFTNSPNYFEQVSRLISGTTRDRISRKNLGIIKIPLPSIAEQKKIVARLDALSAKTRELQTLQSQTAVDLKELKQSILQKSFKGEL